MLQIGQLVDNKYRILDIVGKGGMSVVYLARNERANKSWAVKEVRKTGVENLEVKKNSLIAETEMLKKLSHPHLPAIIDVIETSETYLVVMDYIEGNDLGKILEEQGAQPQDKVIKWGKQLCDVLGYLHSREKPIIYRDLKPANIMLKPDGNITLIDFGTAREIKIADANDTISLGTRGYAAPEQFGANAKTDARTDIYCLGATMYHLVTNHNPSTPPYVMLPIRQQNPALSPGLEKIILKCTSPNPDDRYQSCEELMYALDNYEKIDDEYRKKQKKKIALFFVALFMCILSVAFSGVSYKFAQDKRSADIKVCADLANDENNSFDVREKNYKKAIDMKPDDESYYKGLLDLYVSADENGQLSIDDLNKIKSLESTNDDSSVAPLDELKAKNPDGYADFCKEMGNKCWYKLKGNNKETSAKEWFDKYKDSLNNKKPDSYVNIYCSIAECKNSSSDRADDDEQKYKKLWNLLEELSKTTESNDDEEGKVLSNEEISSEISHNIEGFKKFVDKDAVDSMLNKNKSELIDVANSVSDSSNMARIIRTYFNIDEKTDLKNGINEYYDSIFEEVENAFK